MSTIARTFTIFEGDTIREFVDREDIVSFSLSIASTDGTAEFDQDYVKINTSSGGTGSYTAIIETVNDNIFEGDAFENFGVIGSATIEFEDVGPNGQPYYYTEQFGVDINVNIDDKLDRPKLSVENVTTIARGTSFSVEITVSASNPARKSYPIDIDITGAGVFTFPPQIFMPAMSQSQTFVFNVFSSTTGENLHFDVAISSNIAGSASGFVDVLDPSCFSSEVKEQLAKLKIMESLRSDLDRTINTLSSEFEFNANTAFAIKASYELAKIAIEKAFPVVGSVGIALGEAAAGLIQVAKSNTDDDAKNAAQATILLSQEIKVAGLKAVEESKTLGETLGKSLQFLNFALLIKEFDEIAADRSRILDTFKTLKDQLVKYDAKIDEMINNLGSIDGRLVLCNPGTSAALQTDVGQLDAPGKSLTYAYGDTSLVVNPMSVQEIVDNDIVLADQISADIATISGKTIYGTDEDNTLTLQNYRSDVDVTKVGDLYMLKNELGVTALSGFEVIQFVDARLDLRDIVSLADRPAESSFTPAKVAFGFFAGGTPTLEKLSSLADFAFSQFQAYKSQGVARPQLGPYEALGRAYGETQPFVDGYGSLQSDAFIKKAYLDVFSREPNTAQIEHFDVQIDFFEALYQHNGIAAQTAALWAKGAVVGQMLGSAMLDEAGEHPDLLDDIKPTQSLASQAYDLV